MRSINLIPFRRLEDRRRKFVRRRWVAACGGYTALVAAAASAALALDSRSGSDVQSRLSSAGAEVDRAKSDVTQVRLELDRANSVLRSSRAIAEQPDWSALLALLAAKAGENVTLKGCSVRPRQAAAPPAARPVNGKPASPAPPPDPTLIVNVLGVGSSQSAVSQFAIRLESTGLFDRVTLLDTSREPFAGVALVSFRIECTLAEPAAAVAMSKAAAGSPSLVSGGVR